MFKRILVPLDGSRLSLRALPYATEIVRCFNSEIILLRVVPLSPMPPIGTYTLPEVIEKAEKETAEKNNRNLASARKYLQRNLKRIVPKGIKGSQHAIAGTPAKSIIELSQRKNVDLIVMTTHGRQGINRALLGSVSDEVVRESRLPVLTIRPQKGQMKKAI